MWGALNSHVMQMPSLIVLVQESFVTIPCCHLISLCFVVRRVLLRFHTPCISRFLAAVSIVQKLTVDLSYPQVHILGASLGAFLGQKLAERTFRSQRVHSLFLCNGFTDTTAFRQTKSAKV